MWGAGGDFLESVVLRQILWCALDLKSFSLSDRFFCGVLNSYLKRYKLENAKLRAHFILGKREGRSYSNSVLLLSNS